MGISPSNFNVLNQRLSDIAELKAYMLSGGAGGE